jgi:hypothetical protein
MPCYESEGEREAYRQLFKKEGRYELAFSECEIKAMFCDVMGLLTPAQLAAVHADTRKWWAAHKRAEGRK